MGRSSGPVQWAGGLPEDGLWMWGERKPWGGPEAAVLKAGGAKGAVLP